MADLLITGNPTERCVIGTFTGISGHVPIARVLATADGQTLHMSVSGVGDPERLKQDFMTAMVRQHNNGTSMYDVLISLLISRRNIGLAPAMFELLFAPRAQFELWKATEMRRYPGFLAEAEAAYSEVRQIHCHKPEAILGMQVKALFGEHNLAFLLYGEDDRPADYTVEVSSSGVVYVRGYGDAENIPEQVRTLAKRRVSIYLGEHRLLMQLLRTTFPKNGLC